MSPTTTLADAARAGVRQTGALRGAGAEINIGIPGYKLILVDIVRVASQEPNCNVVGSSATDDDEVVPSSPSR